MSRLWFHNRYLVHNFKGQHNLGSLQKVKQMLRRLRWQQERSGDVYHATEKGGVSDSEESMVTKVTGSVYKFVSGEHIDAQHSMDTEDLVESHRSFHSVREMAVALQHQQHRAEVCPCYVTSSMCTWHIVLSMYVCPSVHLSITLWLSSSSVLLYVHPSIIFSRALIYHVIGIHQYKNPDLLIWN